VSSQNIELKPNSEKQVFFDVEANQDIGFGKIKVYVEAFNEEFSELLNIPVRPPAGLLKISEAGVIKGDDSQTFEIKTDFIENTTSSNLLLSKSPMAEFSKDLRSLIRYPYGCIEQTVSAAFPLIYYRDLAKALEQEKNATVFNPDYFVQTAIGRIEVMQQYNGGMTYWPGGGYINWWATAYATHFMYEAEKDGFEINTKILNNAFKYLKQAVKKKESREYFYRDENGVSRKRTIAKREIFYSLYVLALGGKQNLSIMNYYKSNLKLLSVDSRYLLAATYSLLGDKYSAQAIIPASFGRISVIATFSTFESSSDCIDTFTITRSFCSKLLDVSVLPNRSKKRFLTLM